MPTACGLYDSCPRGGELGKQIAAVCGSGGSGVVESVCKGDTGDGGMSREGVRETELLLPDAALEERLSEDMNCLGNKNEIKTPMKTREMTRLYGLKKNEKRTDGTGTVKI